MKLKVIEALNDGEIIESTISEVLFWENVTDLQMCGLEVVTEVDAYENYVFGYVTATDIDGKVITVMNFETLVNKVKMNYDTALDWMESFEHKDN